MQIEFNWIDVQFNSNSIEEKWDENWYIKYWKSTYNYGIEKKTFEKTHVQKKHIFIPFYLGIGLTKFGIVQRMTHPKMTYGT
jgi:hypothetical protein